MRDRVELESVVAVVDACHAQAQLDDDIAREQVVFADRIIINKTDARHAPMSLRSSTLIRSLNPSASIDFSHHSAVDVNTLLGVRQLLARQPARLSNPTFSTKARTTTSMTIRSPRVRSIVPGSLDRGALQPLD